MDHGVLCSWNEDRHVRELIIWHSYACLGVLTQQLMRYSMMVLLLLAAYVRFTSIDSLVQPVLHAGQLHVLPSRCRGRPKWISWRWVLEGLVAIANHPGIPGSNDYIFSCLPARRSNKCQRLHTQQSQLWSPLDALPCLHAGLSFSDLPAESTALSTPSWEGHVEIRHISRAAKSQYRKQLEAASQVDPGGCRVECRQAVCAPAGRREKVLWLRKSDPRSLLACSICPLYFVMTRLRLCGGPAAGNVDGSSHRQGPKSLLSL